MAKADVYTALIPARSMAAVNGNVRQAWQRQLAETGREVRLVMADSGSGSGEFERVRRALVAVECGLECMKQFTRAMELPATLSCEPPSATVPSLLAETRSLEVSLLECQARIGDGPFDDYLADIEAHKAIDAYAERVLPYARFVRAQLDWSLTPPPNVELNLLMQYVADLLAELTRIDSEVERERAVATLQV